MKTTITLSNVSNKRNTSLKRSFLPLLFSALLFLPSCKNTEPSPSDSISTQAKEMSAAFLKEDFETVADFTSPAVLNIVGGKSNMIAGLKASVENMKIQGMSFNAISFEKPSEIVKHENELQATIIQKTEINYSGGKMNSVSTLVAISQDEGKHWKFIDTSNKDEATVRQTFPNISAQLKFPERAPAVK